MNIDKVSNNKYFQAFSLIVVVLVLFTLAQTTNAQYYYDDSPSCSDLYGIMAHESLSGGCECASGYIFGEDFLGNTTCVSADSVCTDKYGYNSRYDSLSNSCECSYGHVFGEDIFGETSCISEDQACKDQYGSNARSTYGGNCECRSGYGFQAVGSSKQCVSYDSICYDRLGINSTYDSLSDSCACQSGYELSQKNYGSGLECRSCFSKYGINSSWDYINEGCTCDDGYTLKDGECVEKENNVYFKLLDLSESTDEIIVEDEYSGQNYLLEYGFGCGLWIDWYLDENIVLGLGTDFSVDWGDRIVLQDHDATCEIRSVERTFDDHFEEEEENVNVYIPQVTQSNTTEVNTQAESTSLENNQQSGQETSSSQPDASQTLNEPEDESSIENIGIPQEASTTSVATGADTKQQEQPRSNNKEEKTSFLERIISFFKGLFN